MISANPPQPEASVQDTLDVKDIPAELQDTLDVKDIPAELQDTLDVKDIYPC